MKPILSGLCTVLLLAGCTTPIAFENMTEQELLAYNKDRPILEQVYCVKESRTSTHIRKTYCDTVEDWVLYNQRQQSRLDVLSLGGPPTIRSLD